MCEQEVAAAIAKVVRFSPVPASLAESDEQQFHALVGYSSALTWEDIDKRYRSVVLAEAGAGKTFEMHARAKYVGAKGDYAFFIRIEDMENDFEQPFEVGNADTFQQWLDAQNDAWFYLDSVDEARCSVRHGYVAGESSRRTVW